MKQRGSIEKAVAQSVGVQKNFPVDVTQAAKTLGIDVCYISLEPHASGALRVYGKATIGVNDSFSERRQRFIIAHLLGHFALHLGREKPVAFIDGPLTFKRSSFIDERLYNIEIEANRFANELLMPRREIEKIQVFDWHDEAAARKWCGIFGVSETVLLLRLNELEMI